MRAFIFIGLCLGLSACGAVYHSPAVQPGPSDASSVRVVAMTSQSVAGANQSTYRPQSLPAIFSQTAGGASGLRGTGALPEPAFEAQRRPTSLETRLPPQISNAPYAIGVGDVVLLATPQAANTLEELSGLLAAQNRRQGYTVQDDGAITIPDVGRISLAGLTLEEAEAEIFQRLIENQISPAFSLEISEFNSRRVSIGGAVARPTVAPITLTPLYLDEALANAGGVTVSDQDYATIRLYRDGTLYQIPLSELYTGSGLQRILLTDGDSVFVDTEFELEQAQAYFSEQIRLAEFRQRARQNALNELTSEVDLRRAALNEARANYQVRLEQGDVERDYAYLTGEVAQQGRFTLPFGHTATLADALYSDGNGIPTRTANVSQIYILRDTANQGVVAWHLDARNAASLLLATRMELRPNDIVFIAEQPVTRWSRVVDQISPTIISRVLLSIDNAT
ncbi:polysaccharide biosynthesis/export family protein [Cochlodiniinecator piscidefendens]|uniref:polysaccharide biosynthesis/export family protein n=1 Tax=Cochlodiniinecator piscidefendens TaxID=2715756 RepID=UPI001E627C0D|nr:polysaccharide biosynthesis/export family protein [Cochlodiniinecator piscidefendens]